MANNVFHSVLSDDEVYSTKMIAAFGAEMYREGQIAAYREAVAMLSEFHGPNCHPLEGNCACWTETQQKILQSKEAKLRSQDQRKGENK